MQDKKHIKLSTQIGSKLNEADVNVNNVMDHVLYDTEENCAAQHAGEWDKRLAYSS
jgi:hypothetical protein